MHDTFPAEDRLAMSIGHSQRSAPVEGSMRPGATLWLVGGAALALGLLVYWTERPAPHWLGSLGGWLPSFVHTLAFSLFTAALLAPRRGSELGACAFWFAVNLLFEAGQHPQVREPLAETLRRALGTGPAARPLENYFLRGTFDAGDVAAAALCAVAAALLLSRLRQARQYHHAPSPLPL